MASFLSKPTVCFLVAAALLLAALLCVLGWLGMVACGILLLLTAAYLVLVGIGQLRQDKEEETEAEVEEEPEPADKLIDGLEEKSILMRIRQWEQSTSHPFCKDGLTVSDVADQLHLSSYDLSFVLNHSMRMNFNAWINSLKVEEAKALLKDDLEKSVSEIGCIVGYSDVSIFSRNFKKVVGMSPLAFRNSCMAE